ncbi:MAG: SseB family protein [Pseudomonadota bacterium]
MTPLDQAHAAMEANPADDAARLRFFELFASTELFVLLEEQTEAPRLFDTADGQFLLAFDTEARLSGFAGGPADYAALSGRAIAEMIGAQNVGVGFNLEVAPSSFLIPAGGVAWLSDVLSTQPQEVSAVPEEFTPPAGLPEALLTSLDERLAAAEGLARLAYLVGVTYRGGRRGHLLAIIDAAPEAQSSLSRAISDALSFADIAAGELDVAFLAASDPVSAKLTKVGLRFDLPEPVKPTMPKPDPTKPPKLR